MFWRTYFLLDFDNSLLSGDCYHISLQVVKYNYSFLWGLPDQYFGYLIHITKAMCGAKNWETGVMGWLSNSKIYLFSVWKTNLMFPTFSMVISSNHGWNSQRTQDNPLCMTDCNKPRKLIRAFFVTENSHWRNIWVFLIELYRCNFFGSSVQKFLWLG